MHIHQSTKTETLSFLSSVRCIFCQKVIDKSLSATLCHYSQHEAVECVLTACLSRVNAAGHEPGSRHSGPLPSPWPLSPPPCSVEPGTSRWSPRPGRQSVSTWVATCTCNEGRSPVA